METNVRANWIIFAAEPFLSLNRHVITPVMIRLLVVLATLVVHVMLWDLKKTGTHIAKEAATIQGAVLVIQLLPAASVTVGTDVMMGKVMVSSCSETHMGVFRWSCDAGGGCDNSW